MESAWDLVKAVQMINHAKYARNMNGVQQEKKVTKWKTDAYVAEK